ncbi:MAG: phasin family protein [Hyphomicrobiaceae bacterium]|nr:phasin family protein [Hyphomicrobiaceae bacterium]
MNEQFTRQAQDIFNVAKDARIPENFQAFAEDSVSKSREMFLKVNAAAQANAKVLEEVVLASHAGAKSIGEKVLSNTAANTEAAFDAAQSISRAKTLPEAARLQADFMQQQMAAVSAQSKELFELSAKVAKQTFDTINSATAKTMDQFKKAN